MSRPSTSEVYSTQSNRAFIQYNGARPNNPVEFYGVGAPYMILQSVTIPINGAVTNQWVPSRNTIGKYEIAKRTIAPPPIASATMHVLEQIGTLNKFLTQDCTLTAYLNFGACADLSNFLYGWSGKVKIFAEGIVGSINAGNQGEWNAENLIVDQVPLSLKRIYEIGEMGFGRVADSDIVTEIVDVVYGAVARCGTCGAQNDGTEWIYALEKRLSSSSGDQADILYSTDGGGTWTSQIINGIGTSVDPTAIDVVGDKLVVVVASENAYYYATINQTTGAPSSFTKVTTGFVSTKTPNDIYVANPNEIYFAANGGYLYKSTDITQGVSPVSAAGATTNNLNRIAGDGNNTIVAVGASGTVVISLNNGRSWAVAASAPSANSLTAIEVLSADLFWVGDASGGLYYTLTQAGSWSTKLLSNSPAQINDIAFVNDEVGWIAAQTSTPTGLLYSTWNGGRDFTTNAAAPRMFGVPTADFQKANRVAIPFAANVTTASNNVAVGGLGASADGVLIIGSANFK